MRSKALGLAILAMILGMGAASPEAPSSPVPSLAYSTYLGGIGSDGSYGAASDAAGNLYVTGSTDSPDFPLFRAVQPGLAGQFDVFVAKLDRDGELVFSTFFGGSGSEQGQDVAIDAEGNAYVVGFTDSADFPRVGGLPSLAGTLPDVFVLKLDPSGRVLYSTLLGGSGYESGDAVAVDAQGRVYVAGITSSMDFPLRGGLSIQRGGRDDGFLLRLSPAGTELEASTLLGGGDYEHIFRLDVDPAGNCYVAGVTASRDFPLVRPAVGTWLGGGYTGASVGFLAKLAPSLSSLVYSTFFDEGWFLDVAADAAGNTYATGIPEPKWEKDACFSKLNPVGELLFTACVGGSSQDYVTGIALDRAGNVVLGGSTWSPDYPLKDPIQSRCEPREGDFCWFDIFVTKLDPAGRHILFSTYLGGTQPMPVGLYPPEEGIYGLGVDSRGDIYLGGWTYSADFPTVNAVQSAHGGGVPDGEIDAIAVRISPGNQLPDCSGAFADPAVLWPPDGRMAPISILGVADPDGDPVALKVAGITQDEPGADFSGIGSPVARVKAERDGMGDGRVYRIDFEATDPSGASCTGEVRVCVPHDRGRGSCVDGAAQGSFFASR